MREDGGAHHFGVAVDGVNAVDDGDFEAGLQGGLLVSGGEVAPVGGFRVHRAAVPPGEDPPDEMAACPRRRDGAGLDQCHLADFFGEGHLCQQGADAGFKGQGGVVVGVLCGHVF